MKTVSLQSEIFNKNFPNLQEPVARQVSTAQMKRDLEQAAVYVPTPIPVSTFPQSSLLVVGEWVDLLFVHTFVTF